MTYRETNLPPEQLAVLADMLPVQMPTPLRLSALVHRYSITAAILSLHIQQCHAAVQAALENLRQYQVDQPCLAELWIYYERFDELSTMLDTADDDVLSYVIGLPTDLQQPRLVDAIMRARDLALSVRARKAAAEAVRELR